MNQPYIIFSGLSIPVVSMGLDKGHIVFVAKLVITKKTTITPGSFALFDKAATLVGVGRTTLSDLPPDKRSFVKGDSFTMQLVVTIASLRFSS